MTLGEVRVAASPAAQAWASSSLHWAPRDELCLSPGTWLPREGDFGSSLGVGHWGGSFVSQGAGRGQLHLLPAVYGVQGQGTNTAF